jgi:hypothetical protein
MNKMNESARQPLATAGAQYDKCTVQPPSKLPSIYESGTSDYCCQTQLTANKFAGCCLRFGLSCHDSEWRIRCYGVYSIGSSWASTGSDPKTGYDCSQNPQSVVYVASGGSAPVAAPTTPAAYKPRVATVGRVAEPNDAPAAASTSERNTAPTSILGGMFPPGSDPASKPAVLEALQTK